MVPSTWLSVLFFLLLVAPGALFLLQRRTAIADSAFLEISRIVLASLAFSGVAFLVLAVVRQARPDWLPARAGARRSSAMCSIRSRWWQPPPWCSG